MDILMTFFIGCSHIGLCCDGPKQSLLYCCIFSVALNGGCFLIVSSTSLIFPNFAVNVLRTDNVNLGLHYLAPISATFDENQRLCSPSPYTTEDIIKTIGEGQGLYRANMGIPPEFYIMLFFTIRMNNIWISKAQNWCKLGLCANLFHLNPGGGVHTSGKG